MTTKIVLHDERPCSWNRYWSGLHWSERKTEADRVKWLVRAAIDPNVAPYQCPVEIVVTAYFHGKQQDASNICVKPYEDALIGWIIEDDSPAHVTAVTTRSRKDNDNPRVEIEVMPV